MSNITPSGSKSTAWNINPNFLFAIVLVWDALCVRSFTEQMKNALTHDDGNALQITTSIGVLGLASNDKS